MPPDTLHESDFAAGTAFACAVEIFAAFEKAIELNLQAIKTWLHEQHILMGAMLFAPSWPR